MTRTMRRRTIRSSRSGAFALLALVGCGGAQPAPRSEPLSNQRDVVAEPPVDGPQFVRGEIRVHPKARDRVVAGGTVFILIKHADDNGQPVGIPIAVDKLEWAEGLQFELTEEDVLIATPENKTWGDVIVTARYDQDSDAISKEPGDVVGKLRVRAPAEGVMLLLDEIIP